MSLFNKLSKDQKFNLAVSGGSALTSGLFSLIGAGIQNRMNIKNWQMQNEYNTPANQMARFKAAGLNPNLIYDRGDSGSAGSLPSYQLDAGAVKNGIAASAAIKQLQLLDAEKWKATEDARQSSLQNDMISKENFYLDSYLSTRNKIQRINMLYATGQITSQQKEQMLLDARIENVGMSTAKMDYEMSSYLPENVRQGWARVALERLNYEIRNRLAEDEHWFNLQRTGNMQRNNLLLDKDLEYYEADRTFNRRRGAVQSVGGLLSSLGGFGKSMSTPSYEYYPSGRYGRYYP